MKGRDYLKFSTKNNKYLYDVGTHNVYQVDECIYRIIDDIGHLSKEKILKKYQSLYKSVDISLAIKDRKSVVWGKSVDLGGRRIIKKKKKSKKCEI